MLEWMDANKEWLFSGVGITFAGLLIWGFSKIRSFVPVKPKAEIVVKVRVASAKFPIQGLVTGISVIAENHSGKDMLIGNFMLEMQDHRRVIPFVDGITRQPQTKRMLRDGDSVSFYISAKQLDEAGLPPEAYLYAVVDTPLGKVFHSSTEELRNCLLTLLEIAKP